MNNFFSKNIQVISKKNPQLGAKLINYKSESKNIQLIQTSSGDFTLKINQQFLHSRYNPKIEAQTIIKSYNQLPSSDLVILFGFGLGYLFKEIVRQTSSNCEILVYEKKFDIFYKAIENIDFSEEIENRKVNFIIGDTKVNIDITNYKKITTIEHTPSISVDSDFFYEKIKQNIQTKLKEQLIDLSSCGYFGPIWHRNILLNLKFLYRAEDITNYKNRFNNIPGMLVAPGPSLDNDVKFISRQGIIVCILPALRLLLKNGIKPDFVITVDGNFYNYWHTKFIKTENLKLISEMSVSYQILNHWRGNIILAEFGLPFENNLGLNFGRFQMTGTVAGFGLQVLLYFGCNPIIFVGQDFAIINTLSHCKGSMVEGVATKMQNKFNNSETIYYQHLKNEELKTIEGNKTTTNKLLLYKEWFEKKIATEPDRTFINTSFEGAKISGTKISRLQDIKFSAVPNVSGTIKPFGRNIYEDINNNFLRIIKKFDNYLIKIKKENPEKFIQELLADKELSEIISMELTPQLLKFKRKGNYREFLTEIEVMLKRLSLFYNRVMKTVTS